jgi:NifU-like protein involved in Fe-S cluster formation
MDEVIVKYYRRLLRDGFENAGSLENPSIFMDSLGENIALCGAIASSYMHLFVKVANDRIDDMRYLCICDPTANIAVEILCILARGKTLEEAKGIGEESFFPILGAPSAELSQRAKGLLELLNRGICRYQEKAN